MAINIDLIRKRLAGISNGGGGSSDGVKRWKYTTTGTYILRVLPWPAQEDGMPFPEKNIYWLSSLDKTARSVRIVSPEHIGQDDPIKERRIELFTEAKNLAETDKMAAKELKDLAKLLNARQELCVAVVNRKDEEAGPMLWVPNFSDAAQLMNLFLEEDVGDYTDLKNGFDLKVTVLQSNKISPHTGKPVLEGKVSCVMTGRSPAHKDPAVVKKWLENLPDIEAIYKPDTRDQALAKLEAWANGTTTSPTKDVREGTARGPAVADEEDDVVKTKSAAASAKKAAPAKKTTPAAAADALDDAFDELDSDID